MPKINIRLSSYNLDRIKRIAANEGLSYQSLISSGCRYLFTSVMVPTTEDTVFVANLNEIRGIMQIQQLLTSASRVDCIHATSTQWRWLLLIKDNNFLISLHAKTGVRARAALARACRGHINVHFSASPNFKIDVYMKWQRRCMRHCHPVA